MKPVETAKQLDDMAQRVRTMTEALETVDHPQAQRYVATAKSSLIQAARQLELAFETLMNTPERTEARAAVTTDGSEPVHKRD